MVSNFIKMSLKREMTTINKDNLSILDVFLKRLSTRRDEDSVVLSPDGEDGRLVFTEVFLEIGVEGFIGSVVVEDVELYG